MSLRTGTRLGPYEVLGLIGAGGMGEVYNARDSRLDRTVAIKVLPADISADPDRRARFEREAKTIAGLTHPHICTLHDVGDHAGSLFLVMEHLEGETLAHRLEKGPFPAEQALVIASEIAEALSAAHRQGIIHRDLKPGNVMLTKGGAKLLDFGLAKLAAQDERLAASNVMVAPTRTMPLTAEGTIVGTLQYMAPEQVAGKPADTRTDVWALGTVLYEMLTGHRAFDGNSGASVIAAILDRNPLAAVTLPASVTPLLHHILDRCLAKEPDDRWQSAADLALELRWSSSQAPTEQRSPREWTLRGIATMASVSVLSILAGATAVALARKPHPSPAPVTRFVVQLPSPDTLDVGLRPAIALAPDGSQLAYAAVRDGISHLFLRRMDSVVPTVLPGTEGASGPFFSPDGRFVGFFASGKLMKVDVDGGPPTILTEAASGRGAAWVLDDSILFTAAPGTGLWRVPSGGGTPSVVTRLDVAQTERTHRWPDVLPGGTAALITLRTAQHASFDETRIVAVALENGKMGPVLAQGTQPRYAPSGHLIFARGGTLQALRFDPSTLSVSGTATAVVEDVMTDPATGAVQYAISDGGALAYVRGPQWVAARALVRLDRDGHAQPVFETLGTYSLPRLSPDGRRLAVTVEGANDNVWVSDAGSKDLVRLTYETGSHIAPLWTPDNRRIVFSSNRSGSYNLYWKSADGSDTPERLTESTHIQVPGSWSADGLLLAFSESDPATGSDIWLLSVKDGTRRPLVQTRFNEHGPAISPDGGWLAYCSDESGREEIYIQRFPGTGDKRQVSTDGGREPVWSRSGDSLFYRSANRIFATSVSLSPAFAAGRPTLIAEGDFVPSPIGGVPSYDVSPDGRSVLIARESRQRAPSSIQVVLNWFEELKAKVPIK